MAALDYPDKLSNKKSIANRLLVLLFIITSLSMVILIVLSLIVPPAMDTMVETFTAAEPLELPQIEFTEIEKQDVKDSLKEFEQALKADEYVEPLKLDARQLNGLLAEDKKSSNVHLSIEHDTIRAELSLPIDTDLELGPWQSSMRGRYINGIADLKLSKEGDILKADLVSFTVKGQTVPGWLRSLLQREIDKLDVLDSDDARDILSKLARIEFEDGQLVLYPE